MKRQIVKIDRDLCNGCGLCIPNCHEGALQIIDGKATLVSDLMCDGLGACLGHCPIGAITIEERDAQPYDEVAVLKEIISAGKNTVVAHLLHLKDHNETEYLKTGVKYLESIKDQLPFDFSEVKQIVHGNNNQNQVNMNNNEKLDHSCGCPGSKEMSFAKNKENLSYAVNIQEQQSELTQWPVQMHLINPMASYFLNSDLVFAADCVAFSLGNFHSSYLKGKSLAIACPKLDDGADIYVQKLIRLIDEAKVNTITVMMMEVPCCRGLLQMVRAAQVESKRKVPVKQIIVGIKGDILSEEWV